MSTTHSLSLRFVRWCAFCIIEHHLPFPSPSVLLFSSMCCMCLPISLLRRYAWHACVILELLYIPMTFFVIVFFWCLIYLFKLCMRISVRVAALHLLNYLVRDLIVCAVCLGIWFGFFRHDYNRFIANLYSVLL